MRGKSKYATAAQRAGAGERPERTGVPNGPASRKPKAGYRE